MRLISWNVNGLRACIGKGFYDFVAETQPDVVCVQETKMYEGQAVVDLPGYQQFWNSAVKKGYSGTAIFTKEKPLSVVNDIGLPEHSTEGRVITAEYPDFYLVNVYTPNAKPGLARIEYRMDWEDCFRAYVVELNAKKPVIICGDLNVAHQEIDLKNPKANVGNPGFSPQEREKIGSLLANGFVDSFRYLHPDEIGAYSWWSYRFNARANNAGWRIDYFLVSQDMKEKITKAYIMPEVYGSDHCPVVLEI